MSKKPVNFRLDINDINSLDELAVIFSEELGVKFDRTRVIEKLIRDAVKSRKNTYVSYKSR